MITWPTTLFRKDDKLYLHLDGSPDKEDIELKPESQTKFFYGDGTDRQIEFEVDKKGKLAKVCQITWGIKREVSKIK